MNKPHDYLNQSFNIGSFTCQNRLIQGPLAGFSCAPFRKQVYCYLPPAYCVSEMISAHDVLHKHTISSRYLYRAAEEHALCYQLAGNDPEVIATAAQRLEQLGADLIDLNCGCPKAKIRKKKAGSALLEDLTHLISIIDKVKQNLSIPLTIKIRIQGDERDTILAKAIEQAGADALIVHGRRWQDDYSIACNMQQIARIKQAVTIPVIANGDIACVETLQRMINMTGCDGFMISRASTGNPWLFQQLVYINSPLVISHAERVDRFIQHIEDLAALDTEHQAVLQSKSLVRYYFKSALDVEQLSEFYKLKSIAEILDFGKTGYKGS